MPDEHIGPERMAFTLGLIGGGLVAVFLLAVLTALGAAMPTLLHALPLRLAYGYAGMWCVLLAMQWSAGGMVGRPITFAAGALAFGAILGAYLLAPVVSNSPAWGAGVGWFKRLAFLSIPHGATIALAGWIHGDG